VNTYSLVMPGIHYVQFQQENPFLEEFLVYIYDEWVPLKERDYWHDVIDSQIVSTESATTGGHNGECEEKICHTYRSHRSLK
jgi:hypothetical protein